MENELIDVIDSEVAAGEPQVNSDPAGVQNEPQTMHDALFGDKAEPVAESDELGQVKTEEVKENTKPTDDKPVDDGKSVEVDDLTPPDGLGTKASERFQKLANDVKSYREFGTVEELQSMREEAQTLHVFRERVADAQLGEDEFNKVLDYTKAVKTGDWDAAEKFLQEAAYQFSVFSGRPLVSDPLGAYPDLKESVQNLTLEEKHAVELARVRYLDELQKQQQQTQQQHHQQEQVLAQQFEQTRNNAMGQLKGLINQWSTSDVMWAEREQLLASFIQTELKDKSPDVWVASVSAYYKALQSVPTTQQRARTPNAIRPNNMGSVNGGKAPTSMSDALWGSN